VILTNAIDVNEGQIDIDPGDIESVYENSSAAGGTSIIMKSGTAYLVKESFETVERMRHAARASTGS
jgi:uncharacterized protein YlzI (FlbEa/FlbD family)